MLQLELDSPKSWPKYDDCLGEWGMATVGLATGDMSQV